MWTRFGFALMLCCGAWVASAAEYRVLVVMSYEENNPWVREIREGIEGVLGGVAEITWFHMNTKVDREHGPKRAEEAHALFQSLKPHGVIAADDDAQAMFVVPFLKDKTAVPVIFNGVNAAAEKYGYPNAHISGVLERAHARESLAFAKQLFPAIQRACALTNQVPPGQALRAQMEAEKTTYPVRFQTFHLVRNVPELEARAKDLRADCDTLLVDSLEGIADREGRPLDNREVLARLARLYDGPILAGNRYQVEQGAWAAVVKTGQEQGELAAEMLLQALRGASVASLPVARNSRGQRVINVSAMEAHGVVLRPQVLRGATLVRQQP